MKNLPFIIATLFFQLIPTPSYSSEINFFLICSGDSFIKIDLELIPVERKIIKSFEIKNKELVIDVFRGKEYRAEATEWNSQRIMYSVPDHPIMSIVKNYYLTIDRISGYVVETSDAYPPGNTLKYWVFKGFCEKKINREF